MSARQSSKPSLPEKPLAVSVITDATAQLHLGMTARAFREAVVRDHVPHMRLGKRIVVAVEDLRELAHRAAVDAGETLSSDDGPMTADAMLANLGFARGAS